MNRFEVLATGYNVNNRQDDTYHIDPDGNPNKEIVLIYDAPRIPIYTTYKTYGFSLQKACELTKDSFSKVIKTTFHPDIKEYPLDSDSDAKKRVAQIYPKGFTFVPCATGGRWGKPIPNLELSVGKYIYNYYSKGPNRKEPFYICAFVKNTNTIIPMNIKLYNQGMDMQGTIMAFQPDPSKITKPFTTEFSEAFKTLFDVIFSNKVQSLHTWSYNDPSISKEENRKKLVDLTNSDLEFYLVNDLKNPKWDTKAKQINKILDAIIKEYYNK